VTYTVQQVADRFSVDEHAVLGWIRSGDLRAVNVGRQPGKKRPRWRVTEAALAEFELLRSYSPPPPRGRRRKTDNNIINFY
jgi:excisionase family DNA binding protein